ncbi:copper-binding protein [Prosthecomicrobium sp. N25]|uniref:copper-binding protein n=1 Tax=Prosthecomicrobium sp. N25 TaxID=3129254 RepID=UPI003077A8E8
MLAKFASAAALILALSQPAAAQDSLVNGQVTKVDPGAKKITIKHEEIKTLEMPPMTMVFQVANPAFLTKVKAGDKVRFSADRVNGALTVTAIEKGK